MGARAEATRQTRLLIMEAADRLFSERWFDEVSLSDVAKEAGVSQQTVINHFGTKDGLYIQGMVELIGPEITKLRDQVRPGDLDSITRIVCTHYEDYGFGTVRMVAQAGRSDGLDEAIRFGNLAHRDWVAKAFTPQLETMAADQRETTVRLLATVLDAATWYRLRRLEGRTVTQVRADLRHLLEAILASVTETPAPEPR